jgi:hypothetical protein
MSLTTIRRNLDRFVLLGIGSYLFALIFSWAGAERRGFEYDEFWMLQHYVAADTWGRIFTDLAEPNNHPLHAFLVRLAVGQANVSELLTRQPSLWAAFALWALIPFFAYALTQRRDAAVLAGVWCVLSAPLLHYAQTSRGYALQTLLLVLFAFLTRPTASRAPLRFWQAASIVAVGFASVLTVPTSVFYLTPLAVCQVACRFFQWRSDTTERRGSLISENRGLLLAYVVLILLICVWFGQNARQLAAGREQWGVPISSLWHWLSFSWTTWAQLLGWPMIGLIVFFLLFSKEHRVKLCLLSVIIFPILIAPLSRAGPARVYLPLIPFGLLAAAVGFSRLLDYLRPRLGDRVCAVLQLLGLIAPLAFLPRAYESWTPPDWKRITPLIEQTAPPDAFVCYPSSAGLIVRCYYMPEIGREISRRVPRGATFTFVQVDATDAIKGVDPQTLLTRDLSVPPTAARRVVSVEKVPLVFYQAQKLNEVVEPSATERSGIFFAAIGPDNSTNVKQLMNSLHAADGASSWLILNAILSEALLPASEASPTVAVLLAAQNPKLTRDEMRQLTARTSGKIRFYELQQ